MHKDVVFNESDVSEHLRYALMVLNSLFVGKLALLSKGYRILS